MMPVAALSLLAMLRRRSVPRHNLAIQGLFNHQRPANFAVYQASTSAFGPAGQYSGSFEQGANASSSFYGRQVDTEKEVHTVLKKQKYDPVLSVVFFAFGYFLMYAGDSSYRTVKAWWQGKKEAKKL